MTSILMDREDYGSGYSTRMLDYCLEESGRGASIRWNLVNPKESTFK